MLYFDKIDVSEGIDVNKTSASKECEIWHYWYFLKFYEVSTVAAFKFIHQILYNFGERVAF